MLLTSFSPFVYSGFPPPPSVVVLVFRGQFLLLPPPPLVVVVVVVVVLVATMVRFESLVIGGLGTLVNFGVAIGVIVGLGTLVTGGSCNWVRDVFVVTVLQTNGYSMEKTLPHLAMEVADNRVAGRLR